MSELKCCPFCGGEARLYGNSKLIGTRLKHYQFAVCTNDDCGCRTSPCETVKDAIYKWNTRKPMANILEKLEELKNEDVCMETSCIECKEKYKNNSKKDCYEPIQKLVLDRAINIVKQEINNELE